MKGLEAKLEMLIFIATAGIMVCGIAVFCLLVMRMAFGCIVHG